MIKRLLLALSPDQFDRLFLGGDPEASYTHRQRVRSALRLLAYLHFPGALAVFDRFTRADETHEWRARVRR